MAAQAQGLVPVLCVGETLEEREAGGPPRWWRRQLEAVLSRERRRRRWPAAVIAYEPVWAIGTGRTASPEQAQEVHAMIRGQGRGAAMLQSPVRVRILYGGSVKASNARELFAMAGYRRRARRRRVAQGGRIRADLRGRRLNSEQVQ